MFEKPTVVQTMVRENFGHHLALPSIFYYDISNPEIPKKWRDLFEETRRQFIENTADIPIANKAFRLKELDRLYHRGRAGKLENPVDQRATLEQAAKEAGDQFTNKQRHEVAGAVGTYAMSKEEWQKDADERLNQ